MTIPLHLIDAFTSTPFAGNPAGVCYLETPQPEAWLQAVARELQQAETAFLTPRQDGFGLRWFTPTVEVDLCGHATLGSAHFLWSSGRLAPGAVARFHTRSGLLTATRAGSWITLDFPATPATSSPVPAELFPALGLAPVPLLRSKFDYLVVLEDAAALTALRPDLGRLARVESRGVIVTTPSDREGVDFLSRFFAPAVGVDEDPVTGSAHCALAPYWAARLGRPALTGYQASARGGIVRVEHSGERVRLSGEAVTVLEGSLSAAGNSPGRNTPG